MENKKLFIGMSIFSVALTSLMLFNETRALEGDEETKKIIASKMELVNYIEENSKKVKTLSGQNVETEVQMLKRQAMQLEGKTTILLLGVDARKDDLSGRSDAMLVMTLDKKANEMKLVSVPRDAYVPIIGKSMSDKITHAYAFGGIETAQDTVENLFDIKIDHHIVFNFTSFLNIIDEMGGIQVDSKLEFTEQNSKGKKDAIHIKKGKQTLNGEEALAYARMRHMDAEGDVGRGKRQQEVVKATINKLLEFETVSKFRSMYSTVNKSVASDISGMDIPKFIPYLQKYNVDMMSLDGEGFKGENGIYYMKVNKDNLESIKNTLKGGQTDD